MQIFSEKNKTNDWQPQNTDGQRDIYYVQCKKCGHIWNPADEILFFDNCCHVYTFDTPEYNESSPDLKRGMGVVAICPECENSSGTLAARNPINKENILYHSSFMPVYISRHTPGLRNGKDICFYKGEKVKYRLQNGTEYEVVIDSDMMINSGHRGYEAIFPDGRFFILPEQIYDWDGRVI